jgi:hypothetical protein
MKISQLRQLIKEEISKLNSSLKVGQVVIIPKDLTSDPHNRRNQQGTIGYISNDNSLVCIEFQDGGLGIYDSYIFKPYAMY